MVSSMSPWRQFVPSTVDIEAMSVESQNLKMNCRKGRPTPSPKSISFARQCNNCQQDKQAESSDRTSLQRHVV
jgi:hypothetical protein